MKKKSKYFPYVIGYWKHGDKHTKQQSLFSVQKKFIVGKNDESYYMFTGKYFQT